MLAAVPAVSVPDNCNASRDEAFILERQTVLATFARSGMVRVLSAGEVLVRAGDAKTQLYLVESGVLGAYSSGADGSRHPAGFSFIGEVVGLGALDKHVATIEAGVETVVQVLPRSALDDLIAADSHLALRHDAETQAEMELLKRQLSGSARRRTLERVAALLSALAAINGGEGRNSEVVSDEITCGFVADQLGVEIDALEDALLGLNRLGLIETTAGRALRITDMAGLERIAEGVN